MGEWKKEDWNRKAEDLKDKAENLTDKVAGETKAALGDLTDDPVTEAKGKLQAVAADVKNKFNEIKEDITEEGGFLDDLKESITSKKPLGEKAGDVLDDLKEAGSELGEDLKETAGKLKDKAEDVIDEVKDRLKK